jgi:hypothetical protein
MAGIYSVPGGNEHAAKYAISHIDWKSIQGWAVSEIGQLILLDPSMLYGGGLGHRRLTGEYSGPDSHTTGLKSEYSQQDPQTSAAEWSRDASQRGRQILAEGAEFASLRGGSSSAGLGASAGDGASSGDVGLHPSWTHAGRGLEQSGTLDPGQGC